MAIELLSPVGDVERLAAAIRYGANAVYLGATQFGMRVASTNFSLDQLADAVKLAHQSNVKVFLTVNILPRPEEAMELEGFLKSAEDAGIDALIIADIGIIMLARRVVPNMEIHASTQTGIVNHLTATELYNMGCSRVVLARELTFEEIKQIRDNTPPELELEAFVHGAMCMSVSGRCVISNYLTGRDANRGECTQPCRWNYHLVEEKRPGVYFPVSEDESGTTILNARDLCMIEHLKKLRDVGITSFKIEGRAKSSYYTAVVTNAYRTALDAVNAGVECPEWAIKELDKISHREYSQGFYFGRAPMMQSYYKGGYVHDWEVSAIVDSCEDGFLTLSERNKFSVGDSLELLSPGEPPINLKVSQIFDANDNPVETANHPMDKFKIPFDGKATTGSILRRMK